MKEQACMLSWWPMDMRNFLTGFDIEEGKPCVVIANYIRRHDIGLALHKHHGLNRFLRRKTAETLIRRAGCPVLILNQQGKS